MVHEPLVTGLLHFSEKSSDFLGKNFFLWGKLPLRMSFNLSLILAGLPFKENQHLATSRHLAFSFLLFIFIIARYTGVPFLIVRYHFF